MLTNNTELDIATFRLKYQVNAGSHALGDNKNKYCMITTIIQDCLTVFSWIILYRQILKGR